jgi:hypothetical protein
MLQTSSQIEQGWTQAPQGTCWSLSFAYHKYFYFLQGITDYYDQCVHNCLSMGTMLNSTNPLSFSQCILLCVLSLLAWKVECTFSPYENPCFMFVCYWTYCSSSCTTENMLFKLHHCSSVRSPYHHYSYQCYSKSQYIIHSNSQVFQRFVFHKRLPTFSVWKMDIRY